MSGNLGYAVMGLGVGRAHVEAMMELEGCHTKAICDANLERLHQVGDEFGIEPSLRYSSYEEMLSNPKIDIVSICTPSGLHRDHAIMALRANKHILVEKPLEVTLEKVDEINRVAQEVGRYVGCVFQNRFSDGNMHIKQTIDQGRLGSLITSNFHVKWYRTDDYYQQGGGWRGTWALDGGGALMNQSIHTVDLMQWFMGPVKSVFAKSGTFNHQIETEDTAVAVITFENGGIGTLIGTTCAYPGLEVLVQIHGSKGSIYSENANIKLFKLADDDGFEEELKVLDEYGSGQRSKGNIKRNNHVAQVQDMVDAVREGRSPVINGIDGNSAVEIILAIYESARSGKEVFL